MIMLLSHPEGDLPRVVFVKQLEDLVDEDLGAVFGHRVHVVDVVHGQQTQGTHCHEPTGNNIFDKYLQYVFGKMSPEPFSYLLLIISCVQLQVLNIIHGEGGILILLVPLEPPSLS